jgi:Ser/Thr protein kinase RdoA (MazF antagonist)
MTARAFGGALGKLDRPLAGCPADPFFADQASVFSRCKDVDQVVRRYMPACDNRFPGGYRQLLVEYAEALSARTAALAGSARVLTHVDANTENTIFSATGTANLIDLTPEMRLPGYSLGAALYWWAYPWQSNVLDVDIARDIAAAYAAEAPLPPAHLRAIAGHMLNQSLMELAFPLGCLVDSPPAGARPMEDLAGRMARAGSLLAEIGRIDRALTL